MSGARLQRASRCKESSSQRKNTSSFHWRSKNQDSTHLEADGKAGEEAEEGEAEEGEVEEGEVKEGK